MTDKPPEGELHREFEQFGQNLKAALKTAWESEESRRLQAELKSGMAALEAGLQQAAQEVTTGEAGQKLRAEAEDLSRRVKSGQVESQVRRDLVSALQTINRELQKMSRPAGGTEGEPGGGSQSA
jgi:hypothetical protein